MTYGENCANECKCNGAQCSSITGECICAAGSQGKHFDVAPSQKGVLEKKRSYDRIVGRNDDDCVLVLGKNCEKPCDEGFFGDCLQKCNCSNGNCSSETGQCFCAVGWKGHHCDRPCDEGTFGKDCKENCDCQNNGACDPQTGECTCSAGWTGKNCEKKCQFGYFGFNCELKCDCNFNNSITCDPVDGHCICKSPWTG